MRIGILEDDVAILKHLEMVLRDAGYICFTFQSGQRLVNFLKRETVDILLLDWNVPDISGISIISWLKQNEGGRTPVLMVSCRTSEEDIVSALEGGADDYVVKPVQPTVLLARIAAVCRRRYPVQYQDWIEKHGDYVFDTRMDEVTFKGRPVSLSAKEFSLALLLFRNMHRTLSRSYIFELLWGLHPDVQTRTLDAHVSRIRAKLELRPEHGLKLVPVYAYGYRLETAGSAENAA